MTEQYTEPEPTDVYTIYTKSGCPNCTKAKKLLDSEKNNILIVDCDEYIIEDKPTFLQFIKDRAGKEWKTFPIIFHKGEFIGGYEETKTYKERINAFDDI